jgi:hypothetical protein
MLISSSAAACGRAVDIALVCVWAPIVWPGSGNFPQLGGAECCFLIRLDIRKSRSSLSSGAPPWRT